MINWSNPSSWCVLIVDDEPDNLELIADSLAFYGVYTRVAASGADALAILDIYQPTFILLDLSMPKMDGWELRTKIKALPGLDTVPILALTAHAMAGDKERVLAAGFDGYLAKPINIPTFIRDLQNAVDERGTLKMFNWQALVIEDEADSMELVRGILDYHGVTSVGASNGEDALHLLETLTPNIMIVDLALPGIDGWTFLNTLKKDDRLSHIPCVAVTAYHNPFLARTAIDAGFNAYFAKPIDATSFVRELQHIVGDV